MAVLLLAEKLERPFMTYSAEELEEIEGIFPESEFVQETVGVGNVSARAAARSAGKGYRLLYRRRCVWKITHLKLFFKPS